MVIVDKWGNLLVRWTAWMHLSVPEISFSRHAGWRSERGGNRIGINAWTWCFDFRNRSESFSFSETVSHVHHLVAVHQSRRRKFIYVDPVEWTYRVMSKIIRRGSTQTSRRSGSIVHGCFRHRAIICAGMDESLRRCDGNCEFGSLGECYWGDDEWTGASYRSIDCDVNVESYKHGVGRILFRI